MICIECLNRVSSACEIKRDCIEADKKLRESLRTSREEEQQGREAFSGQSVTAQDPVAAKTGEIQDEDSQQTSFILEIVETDSQEVFDEHLTKGNSEVLVEKSKEAEENLPRRSSLRASPTSKSTENESANLNSRTPVLDPAKTFSCDNCDFSSKRKKNLERHILAVHVKSHKFYCSYKECDRLYTTQTALKLHFVRDHDANSPYQCEKCRQKFNCESLFRIHSQRLTCRPRKSSGKTKKIFEKSLECPHCDFRTAHKFSLTQHVKLIHLKIRKTFKCSHCEDKFTNRTSLNQHIFNFHNLTHIRCVDCDQAFTSDDQLKQHKETLKCHARKATDEDFEETPSGVTCKLCNRKYRNKKEWITHYFNHHKFKTVCDICNVKLATYASLKNHKKTIHEKIKRFACDQCPKVFSAKHTLVFHLNIHSGTKPFGCKFCSFKASDRSSVSKHQKKLHSGKT
jgi:hypothetical protein